MEPYSLQRESADIRLRLLACKGIIEYSSNECTARVTAVKTHSYLAYGFRGNPPSEQSHKNPDLRLPRAYLHGSISFFVILGPPQSPVQHALT